MNLTDRCILSNDRAGRQRRIVKEEKKLYLVPISQRDHYMNDRVYLAEQSVLDIVVTLARSVLTDTWQQTISVERKSV